MKKNFRVNNIIDIKIGLAGGVVMGVIVFLINYNSTGDPSGSTTAALKQGIYTFFFGGFIMKLCESLATRINPRILAVTLAVIIPSFISLALTFGVHSMKGTPRPVESTIPTAIFVIPSTLVWGFNRRNKKERNPGEQENKSN